MQHILSFAVGILIIVGLMLFFDVGIDAVITSFSMLNSLHLVAFLLIFLIQIVALSQRWKIVVKCLKHPIDWPRGYFLLTTATGLLLSTLLPSSVGSPSYRILSLKLDHKIPVGDATFSVTFDSVFGVAISLIFLIPALLTLFGLIPSTHALLILLAFLPVLITLSIIHRGAILESTACAFGRLITWTKKINFVGSRLNSLDLRFGNVVDVTPNRLLYLWAYGLAAYFSICLGSWIVLVALEIEVDVIDYLVLFPLVTSAVLIAITPGGIGIQDAVWVGILTILGVDGATATEYAIVRRILYEIFLVGLGSIAFVATRRLLNR